MLPFSLGAAIVSIAAGFLLTKTGKYRPIIWVACLVAAVGFGLMIMLDETSSA